MARGRVLTGGAIKVDILAENAQFTKAINQARTRLQRFRDSAVRIAKRIARNWKQVGIAIAGLAVSVGYSIKKMTDYSSSLVEASRATGLTIKQLERMRTLFEGDGIGIARTDKAMQEFNVRIGFAQRGIGQYTRAFEELGVAVRNQDGTIRSQHQLLLDVSEALRNTGSESRAASLAYELFGRSGKELLPILRRYGTELDRAAKDANRFNTLTAQQHEDNKELGQSLLNLRKSVTDLAYRGLALLAPHLQEIADDWMRWVQAMKDNPRTFDRIADALERVAQKVKDIVGAMGSVYILLQDILAAADHISSIFASDKPSLGESGLGTQDYYKTAIRGAKQQRDRAIIEYDAREATYRGRLEGLGLTPRPFAETRAGKNFQLNIDRANRELSGLQDDYRELMLEVRKDMRDFYGSFNPVSLATIKAQRENASNGGSQGAHLPAAPYRISGPGAMFPLTQAQHAQMMRFRDQRELNDYKRRKATMGESWHRQRSIFRVTGVSSASDPQMAFGNRWPEMLPPSYPLGGQAYAQSQRQQFTEISGMMMEWAAKTLKARLKMAAPSSMVPSGAVGMPTEILPPMMEWAAKTLAERSKMVAPSSLIPSGPVAMPTEVLEPMTEWAGKTLAERLKMAPPSSVPQGEVDIFLKRFMPTEVLQPMVEWAAKTLNERIEGMSTPITPGMMDWASRRLPQHQGRIYHGTTDWQDMTSLQAEKLKQAMEEAKRGTNELRSAFDQMGSSIVDNFQNAGEALRQFARDLVKIGWQRLVLNPIGNSLFGASDGSTEGLFGGFFNDIFPAGGAAAGMGMGAKATTIVYNINSTDGPGVRAALAEATPGIIGAAQSTIMDNSNRYGQTQRMIRGTR